MSCVYQQWVTLCAGLCILSSGHPASSLISTLSETCEKESRTPCTQNNDINMAMKAVQVVKFGGVENLQVQNVQIPQPAADEVLMKVKYAGVNPVDIIHREGYFPGITAPFTLGVDSAGVVESVGSAVTKFSKGDRVLAVFSSGSTAEYTTAKEKHASLLHESTSFEEGAAIGIPYYTAYSAIFFKAKVQPGELVLVHGASGGVGLACVQILKSMGCRVIGTAGTPEGLEHVKKYGADFVFNHRETGYMEKIKEEVSKDKDIDVILEMNGAVNFVKDLQYVAERGRIVIIGCQGIAEVDPLLVMVKEVDVVGVNLYKAKDSEWELMHPAIRAGQSHGWVKPYIGKVYSLNEVGTAHHDLVNTSGVKGKLLIKTSN